MSVRRRLVFRFALAHLLVALGACAQRTPQPETAVPPATSEWLTQDRRSIGVVALGPELSMGQH